MKMKKWIVLPLLPALLLTLLSACGAASNDMAAAEAPKLEESAYEVVTDALYSSGTSASGAANTAQTGQKMIRKVNINAETEDLEPLLNSLSAQIAALGGYVESQDIYNGSSHSAYRYRSANLVIRIPADQLDSFIQQVKDVSNVVNYNESQEDVTLTYVSTESRIKALETEQERLLELMDKAEKLSDLLEIEARLTDVRYELENVTSQLRVLANKVNYATVNLYIDQVKVYTEVEEQTVWQRIGTGFKKNLVNIGESLENFFVWFVTYSPQLVTLAAVAAVVITLLRRREQKRRKKQAPPNPPQET